MLEVEEITKDLILSSKEIISDYEIAIKSREASVIGRKEVFMGKAKFGIFGDGKELPQIALSKVFKNGDFRSGYYRDQTLLLAIDQFSIKQFFSQLYAHTDVYADPSSAGRMMNCHFGNRLLDKNGQWVSQLATKNSTSDISPTAGQIPRIIGLAYASKLYRSNPDLVNNELFSDNGNEIVFGTIGNASTSEGHFFEAINAISVMQLPVVMSVWDDDYGISVPKEYHTAKFSISTALKGMEGTPEEHGIKILEVKGWDYEALINTYKEAEQITRSTHQPVLVHVVELTQPQGHSTSGSHERYKSKERLEWEKAYDCNLKFREWILDHELVSPPELDALEKKWKKEVKDDKNKAWNDFISEIKTDLKEAVELIDKVAVNNQFQEKIYSIKKELLDNLNPLKSDVIKTVKKILRYTRGISTNEVDQLKNWLTNKLSKYSDQYNSHLYSESNRSALKIKSEAAVYSDISKTVDGREVLQQAFDKILSNNPEVFAIGEDVGKIGDVNQGFAGLQDKYGALRVSDTSIRETTIVGQGVGAAIRGLRPIVEIQYLDYLLYALETLSDDLACLHYRTKGGQKAPVIIRTRGHRLEGVWHSGSPIGMILNSLRGICVLSPRNMTQAAGFYNTMLASDDSALIIESLNGYRLKERIPDNLESLKVPVGVPEILRSGQDITIVTYGSMCRIVMEAARQLAEFDISCEVIDAQTLLPFDVKHSIVNSLEKTNKLVVADEDVPGGASAFILQKILEEQEGYKYLDAQPITITGEEHRPAYGSDGDYFSKPNVEIVFEKIYDIMHAYDPKKHPFYINS